MATHVLVALDGSQQSWAAFDHAVSNYDGETITTLHVVDPMEGYTAITEAVGTTMRRPMIGPSTAAKHSANRRELERTTRVFSRRLHSKPQSKRGRPHERYSSMSMRTMSTMSSWAVTVALASRGCCLEASPKP